LKGDGSTLDAEAIEWLNDSRGKAAWARSAIPNAWRWTGRTWRCRSNVLSQSFVKFVTAHVGVSVMAQLRDMTD